MLKLTNSPAVTVVSYDGRSEEPRGSIVHVCAPVGVSTNGGSLITPLIVGQEIKTT